MVVVLSLCVTTQSEANETFLCPESRYGSVGEKPFLVTDDLAFCGYYNPEDAIGENLKKDQILTSEFNVILKEENRSILEFPAIQGAIIDYIDPLTMVDYKNKTSPKVTTIEYLFVNNKKGYVRIPVEEYTYNPEQKKFTKRLSIQPYMEMTQEDINGAINEAKRLQTANEATEEISPWLLNAAMNCSLEAENLFLNLREILPLDAATGESYTSSLQLYDVYRQCIADGDCLDPCKN